MWCGRQDSWNSEAPYGGQKSTSIPYGGQKSTSIPYGGQKSVSIPYGGKNFSCFLSPLPWKWREKNIDLFLLFHVEHMEVKLCSMVTYYCHGTQGSILFRLIFPKPWFIALFEGRKGPVHPREQTSDIPGMNGEPEVEQYFVLVLFIVRTRRPHSEN